MHEPPVVTVKNVGNSQSGPDSLEKSLHDSPSSNEISNDVPEDLHQKPALAGITLGSNSSGHKMGICLSVAALLSVLPFWI